METTSISSKINILRNKVIQKNSCLNSCDRFTLLHEDIVAKSMV